MPGCAAIGCINRSEKGYAMKCFPRDPLLRRLWTEKVCRADWEPSKNSFLCHEHFDANQWGLSQSGRVKLKRHAVPSIFEVTSTRKSPRKRRKYSSDECNRVPGFAEDSLDYTGLITARNTYQNQFLGSNSLSSDAMRNENQQLETIVISDDSNQGANKVEATMESDQDLDDIERKLRWICEGESQSDQKSKRQKISGNTNGKIVSSGTSVDDKTLSSRLNGDGNEDKTTNATSRKRRSRYESTRDTEKVVDPGYSLNGFNTKDVRDKRPCVNLTSSRESMFTIKVTGIDEDVNDIVKSLGTEPILQYKSSTESTRNRNGFVTSVYSVIDRSISSNGNELLKPKVEIDELSCKESRTNWNWQENEYLKKLATESSNDNDNSMNFKQLQKKVKLQAEAIRTLTKRLEDCNDVAGTINKSNSRADGKVSTGKRTPCDCKIGKDHLIKDLSERLIRLDDVNKNLNKHLTGKNQEIKKLEWQVRQRDNRIKELNWKLEKASKYLDRAEKNTNTYRKKMISMRSLLRTQKTAAEPCRSNDSPTAIMRKPQIFHKVKKERIENEDLHEVDEKAVYRTVQDIFDESNDCDDDISVIDTREDFLREFKGAF